MLKEISILPLQGKQKDSPDNFNNSDDKTFSKNEKPFFIEAWNCIKKETPAKVFSCQFCKIS